jgi:transposase
MAVARNLRSNGEVANGSSHLTLAYSRRELAEMIGGSTETAIRLLGKLKRKHLLATHQRERTVTDIDTGSRASAATRAST